jgi:hypothetical protein
MSPSSGNHRSRPTAENSPLSPVKTNEPTGSRTSQSAPPARPVTGPFQSPAAEERSNATDSRERSWPPRTTGVSASTRSVTRSSTEQPSESESEPTKPGADPSRSPPFGRPR